ncbi:MAG: hypothetical protein CK425_02265 [Parachlamydia sp.]|nr:MAG: hypothetical protein CK425_02265 [Parachlamydia sp.]
MLHVEYSKPAEALLKPLELSPERTLISQFYKPEPLRYYHPTLTQKNLNLNEFKKSFANLVSILATPLNKETYADLTDYVVTRIEFTTCPYEERVEELTALIRKWSLKFFDSKGITASASPFQCQHSSFISPPLTLLKKVTGIVCSDYAFLQLGEERSYLNPLSELGACACHLSILKEWGYIAVDKALPGDLVVYLENQHAEHYGILNHNGKVISKWGSGEVFEHPLNLLLEEYGTHVLFYRKPVYQEILEELFAKSESGIQIESVQKHAQELIKSKLATCHQTSYAFYFFRAWSDKLFPDKSSSLTVQEPLTTEEWLALAASSAREIPFKIII